MDIPPIALGVIIAAVITGFISFAGLILAKEQKTSEFRQSWIDSLREEMSEYLAQLGVLVLAHELLMNSKTEVTNSDLAELAKNNRSNILEVNKLEARLRLRLNPSEHANLIQQLHKIHEFVDSVDTNQAGFQPLEDALIKSTQTILKSEWSRVKKGEYTFRIVKGVAIAILLLGIALWVNNITTTKPTTETSQPAESNSSNQTSNKT